MPPHITHLCKIYNMHQRFNPKVITRYVLPLFQLRLLDLKPYMTPTKRHTLFRGNLYHKTHQNKNFTQVACLMANVEESNCRREKLINMKRDCVLEFLNRNKRDGVGFWLTLSKANYWVPEEELVKQLEMVLEVEKEKVVREDRQKGGFNNINIGKVPISQILDRLEIKKWSSYLHHHFPNKTHKTMSLLQLQNSYLQVSILNFYKINFSKNPQKMYQDMKDFDKMLAKFNFLRFFMTSTYGNAVRNQKNCEAFVRRLKWRTQQSEEYLLFLVRNCSWERNCITVQNFVHLYEKEFMGKGEGMKEGVMMGKSGGR